MKNITIQNHIINFPESWDDLTAKQIEKIGSQFADFKDEATFRMQLILHFTGLKILTANPVRNPNNRKELLFLFKFKGERIYINHIDFAVMMNLLDWMFTTIQDKNGSERNVLSSKLDHNPWPVIKHKGAVLLGPADRLFNSTMEEFIMAETYFQNFVGLKSHIMLDKLIAVLYRKKDISVNPDDPEFSGDLREPFNDFLVDSRVKLLKDLDRGLKYGIFIFYQGCRNFIHTQFPTAFKPSTNKQTGKDMGFLGLVDALSGGDVTKNNAVRKSMLYDVLVRLEQAAKEKEKMEQIVKK